ARAAHGVRLVDRDRGWDALDALHLWLVHAVEELARVWRESLDVATLALGIQRVEHERGLAGAGNACHDDELAERDLEVEVLQIVLARAVDGDDAGPSLRHGCLQWLWWRWRQTPKSTRAVKRLPAARTAVPRRVLRRAGSASCAHEKHADRTGRRGHCGLERSPRASATRLSRARVRAGRAARRGGRGAHGHAECDPCPARARSGR